MMMCFIVLCMQLAKGEVVSECSLYFYAINVIVSMEPLAAYQIVCFTEDFIADDVEVLA